MRSISVSRSSSWIVAEMSSTPFVPAIESVSAMFSVPAVRRAHDADARARLAAPRSRGRARRSPARRASRPPARGRRRAPGPRRRGTSSSRRGRSGTGRGARGARRGACPRPRSAGELAVQPLGVVARIGGRALGEEDADLLAGPLALGRRGVRGRGDLVGREAGLGGAPEHLRHDPAERLGPPAMDRPIGDDRARAVPAQDVAVVGEAPVDGADGVRVDAQGGAQLAHGRRGARRAGAGRTRSGRRAASRSGWRSGRPNRARRRGSSIARCADEGAVCGSIVPVDIVC